MVIKVLVFTPDVLTTTEGKRLKTNREETGLYRLLEGGGDSTHRARGYRYVTCDITRDSIIIGFINIFYFSAIVASGAHAF